MTIQIEVIACIFAVLTVMYVIVARARNHSVSKHSRLALVALTAGIIGGYLYLSRDRYANMPDNSDSPRNHDRVATPDALSSLTTQSIVPIVKTQKAGVWSDWVLIFRRRITILPNDDGVVYEFRDFNGIVKSITSEEMRSKYSQDSDGRRNLADGSKEVRFRSAKDVQYLSEAW